MSRLPLTLALLAFVFSLFLPASALAQTNAFSYQGSLVDSGGFADGEYDFQCRLHASLTGGASLGTVEVSGVQVTDGLFTIELDFGSTAFSSGTDRFLEIGVRVAGDPGFTTLEPRTRLDSVPFAAHADKSNTATFASTGPFQPIDTTPGSTSGTRVQTIVYSLVFNGSAYRQSFDIEFPVQIQRDSIITSSGISGGQFDEFLIRVSKPYNLNDQWYQHFVNATNRVDVIITVVSSVNNQTTYSFTDGFVGGYEFGHNGSLTETLTIHYAPDAGNPFDISGRVSRNTTGHLSAQGNTSPTLGGETLLPGSLRYNYDQVSLPFAGAGSLPNEIRLFNAGFPSNALAVASVSYLLNTHEDRTNTLWNDFVESTNPAALELRNGNTLIWTPGISPALLRTWTLDRADDGGLFETYELDYNPNIILP